MLFGDAALPSEAEATLIGRALPSVMVGCANKLFLRDALLITSGEVKRLLAGTALASAPSSAPLRSMLACLVYVAFLVDAVVVPSAGINVCVGTMYKSGGEVVNRVSWIECFNVQSPASRCA